MCIRDRLKADGENVVKETVPVMKQTVEYTLALLLSSQPVSGSGYEYKYVTSQSTFELVLKVLKVMDEGVSALKDAFFSLFSWKDFVTGGGEDTYVSNIDASGDIFTSVSYTHLDVYKRQRLHVIGEGYDFVELHRFNRKRRYLHVSEGK